MTTDFGAIITKKMNDLTQIENKLDKIDKKFNFLQDIILQMKNELEILKKANTKDQYFSKLTFAAQKGMIHFLDNKDPECERINLCVRLLEGGIYKVLQVYNQQGPNKAINLLDSYLKTSDYKFYKKKCNKDCLSNSMQIYSTLKDLITAAQDNIKIYTEELISLNNDLNFNDGIEDEINRILTPLSNVIRLKILKDLRNGGKTYSQLEKDIGIKAGHLIFHMEKLIKAGYVSQENRKYMITIEGLKALRYLIKLKEEFF
ncbi:MAG: winged helix-turn-helix domain-containing protein [Candidatus Odinarchaeota archaeon]